jgi:hypothetical protein
MEIERIINGRICLGMKLNWKNQNKKINNWWEQ